jgi:hypothetical protein
MEYNNIDGIEWGQFNDLMDDLGYYDNGIFSMDEFNDIFTDEPWQAVRSAFYGERFNFENDNFNPNDKYFTFNGYGNLVSIPDYYLQEYCNQFTSELLDYVNDNYIYLDGVEPIV